MSQINKSAQLNVVFFAAGLMVFAASLIGKASAETKIVEGFVSHGALQWPEYIATEFGWFKENGVDVDMVVVGAGAAQQVSPGALNLGYTPRFHPCDRSGCTGQDCHQCNHGSALCRLFEARDQENCRP
jgi:ABC-type nitrate/sulfonate/bicarbonate transport system substrate-binding protein